MGFPVDEIHIVAAEQELGWRLPAALRTRLQRSNGGDVLADDED